MTVQVVHIHQWNIQAQCQSFRERCAHMERAWQAWSAGERYGIDVGFINSCLANGFAHHWHNVLLVRA